MVFSFSNRKQKEMERQLKILEVEKAEKARQERWEKEKTERDREEREREWKRKTEIAEEKAERVRQGMQMEAEFRRNQLEALERERSHRIEKERQELEMQRALEESREIEFLKAQQREDERRKIRAETTPEALHRIRDLVRTRYKLDMEIWSLRDSRAPDRPVVIMKMERSDAVLGKIWAIVETWEEGLWTPEEWKLAQGIKERIMKENKRWWSLKPPWNE